MSRTDAELVGDALDHLAALQRHLARGDLDDETIADAVSLRLAAAIEAIAATSSGFRDRVFADDWKVIWATQNRIAQGYASVDLTIIRETVVHDLPGFESKLRQAL
ncbi:HepT-like ribonuclease domain-containing protein [Agromyces italicus]|uniref:HepT-like ribonuclease domain-containing protein n=1 Tax=Agromyces italicus TaxID=279572 RepID=UPI0003B5AD68|nr:HepT-like ribonuclease domain-containing protein [Agromyces italicus]